MGAGDEAGALRDFGERTDDNAEIEIGMPKTPGGVGESPSGGMADGERRGRYDEREPFETQHPGRQRDYFEEIPDAYDKNGQEEHMSNER